MHYNSVIYKVFSTLNFMVNIPHNNQVSVYTHTCVMKWNIAIAGIMPLDQAMHLHKDMRAISRGQPTNAVIPDLKKI